jgi:hypothetical protein
MKDKRLHSVRVRDMAGQPMGFWLDDGQTGRRSEDAPALLSHCRPSGNYLVAAWTEMPITVTSTVCILIRHWWSDLAGNCACGQFVVSTKGEAYYVRGRLQIENSGKVLTDDAGLAR